MEIEPKTIVSIVAKLKHSVSVSVSHMKMVEKIPIVFKKVDKNITTKTGCSRYILITMKAVNLANNFDDLKI